MTSVSRSERFILGELGWGKFQTYPLEAALNSVEKRKISYVRRKSNPYTKFGQSIG